MLARRASRPESAPVVDIAIGLGGLAARAATQARAKSPDDLAAGDMDVMVALRAQGKPYRARPTDLAAWSGVSAATITRRADRLVERCMVSRTYDHRDRRICWIALTRAGLRQLGKEISRVTS